MAVMRRDVNLGLLLLIVAAIIMFSGFTVYYQTTFKNLSTTYQNEMKQLDKITKDLESKRSLLNDTSTQLILKQQKEEDLSQKFTDVRTEKEQLQADKTKLEGDLVSTKSTLAQTQADLQNTIVNLGKQQKLAQELDAQIVTLKQNVANLNAKIDSLNAKVDCLKSKADADEGTC